MYKVPVPEFVPVIFPSSNPKKPSVEYTKLPKGSFYINGKTGQTQQKTSD
jgi:hypothetical protein